MSRESNSSNDSDQEEIKQPAEVKPEQNSVQEPDSLIALVNQPLRGLSGLRSRASSENSEFNSRRLSNRNEAKS